VFEADREADEVARQAAGDALLLGHLAVRGAGGVQDQALGVADVGQVREEVDGAQQVGDGSSTGNLVSYEAGNCLALLNRWLY
jgi:hypothetical protein